MKHQSRIFIRSDFKLAEYNVPVLKSECSVFQCRL